MSDGTLREVSGVPTRAPVDDEVVLFAPAPDMTPTVPRAAMYLCRWDRPVKEGEKITRLSVEAASHHEAAVAFARECDHENPRPPARRVAVVKLPGKEEVKVKVTVRATLAYETFDE